MSPRIKNPFEFYNQASTNPARRNLDWEESALDSESNVEGFASEEDRSPFSWRWLQLAILGACIVIVSQLFNLQVIQGSKLKLLAEGNRLRIQTVLAPRGYIFDRYGEQLARNTASFSLIMTPVDLPREGVDTIIANLASMFAVPEQELRDMVNKADRNSLEPVVVKRNVPQQETILFETHAAEFAGFSVQSIPIRDYVNAEIFSHVLGYTGIIAENELAEEADGEYELNDFIGKSGVELSYEKYLRGINGNRQVEVDASGRPVKVLGSVDPEPGNVVQLNIDKGLQEQLYQSFIKNSPRVKGAAVALNPRTGEILALVSVPGYNNNLFAPGISSPDYQSLLEDKNLPLFNRAIAGTYPPGSTIKLVGAAAALEEQVVDEHTMITDRGVLVIPNQFDSRIKYNFYGWNHSGLGPMTVRSAIAQSSDIYFYTVAGGHPNSDIQGLGAERLADYYRKFGMGASTGIDLQGEKSGVVADPNWKAEHFAGDAIASQWYLGDTYHIAIGQGDMLATPLQVAIWTSAIANGGTLNKPRVVKNVKDQNGNIVYEPQPEILIKKTVSDGNIRIVQEGMREDIIGAHGTGRSLASLPISSAGKTGTSQFDGSDPNRTHAWFTSYAPYEDPQIVVTVLVEAGGEGHAAAVPIAKEALDWWARNRFNK
jgi:penicillin-binding protein 2